MARDEGLEEVLRGDLAVVRHVTEKAMFGGRAWLLNGHLLCGARADGMLVRLGRENEGWALALEGVEPMVSRSRTMAGWVRAGPDIYGDDAIRHRLIEGALAFNGTLPAR